MRHRGSTVSRSALKGLLLSSLSLNERTSPMTRWSALSLACLVTVALGPRTTSARPTGSATQTDPAQQSAQSRTCQNCIRQECNPPMTQCGTQCETAHRDNPRELRDCQDACDDRWGACIATCRSCQGVYNGRPGVTPFPRERPGEGGEGAAPEAPRTTPRVVRIRRR